VIVKKPKKVLAVEPDGLSLRDQAAKDSVVLMSGSLEFAPVPQPDWVIAKPATFEPQKPKKEKKTKKQKKEPRVVKIVTERIEKATEESDDEPA